jgi:uncharacterized glyoxalase superfamily protein PhnB
LDSTGSSVILPHGRTRGRQKDWKPISHERFAGACVQSSCLAGQSYRAKRNLMERNKPLKYRNAVPVIATADVRSTVSYYKDILGFNQHFVFGDPPVYAGIERDGVLLYIALDAKLALAVETSDLHPEIFLWVQDVDKVFEEHKRRGARIFEEISDRPWDARQYVIEEPNGYHLKVAEPID